MGSGGPALTSQDTAAVGWVGMDAMPQPGDLVPYSFTAIPGRCCRMIYSPQLQASHCHEPPVWKGVWKDRRGKSWYVRACAEHAPKSPEQRTLDSPNPL